MTDDAYGLMSEVFAEASDAVAGLCAVTATWIPDDAASGWWVFASGPAGYVTGVLHQGQWHLTNQDHRRVTGLPAKEHLYEIRLFKPGSEIRLFPIAGTWQGSVRGPDRGSLPPEWLQPRAQGYLVGRADWTTRLGHQHASVIRDLNTGQDVVVPLSVPDGNDVTVSVLEYFGMDDATGAVRVVATCWQEFTLTPPSSKPKKRNKK